MAHYRHVYGSQLVGSSHYLYPLFIDVARAVLPGSYLLPSSIQHRSVLIIQYLILSLLPGTAPPDMALGSPWLPYSPTPPTPPTHYPTLTRTVGQQGIHTLHHTHGAKFLSPTHAFTDLCHTSCAPHPYPWGLISWTWLWFLTVATFHTHMCSASCATFACIPITLGFTTPNTRLLQRMVRRRLARTVVTALYAGLLAYARCNNAASGSGSS